MTNELWTGVAGLMTTLFGVRINLLSVFAR